MTPILPPSSCYPNPCGPYSICDLVGPRVVCNCKAGYIGGPPNCRPECVINAECPSNQACIAGICGDPCINSCGINANCQTINHNPICSCTVGYTGNPFENCYKIPGKSL